MARDKASDIAEREIDKAKRSEMKELDLSVESGQRNSQTLTGLPETLRELTKLESIDLSGNRVEVLPEWLGELTQLKRLKVTGNRLTTLPSSLGNLMQLQTLDLSHNQLTALPDTLGQLKQLRTLDIRGNQLAVLPASVGSLANLESLDASANKLTLLPSTLSQLHKLDTLNLSNNALTGIPEGFGDLARLQVLHLFANQLTALPVSLGQLKSLRKLSVGTNRLQTLPESLSDLTQLQTLDLSNNLLTALPRSLDRLTQLHTIYLDRNQLTELPETLTLLALNGTLTDLYLHQNPSLGMPDEVLGPPWDDLKTSAKDPKEILDYYFSTRGEAGQALRELRLIVVGRPKVGKTTLIRRLRGLSMDPNEAETHGIDILPLDLHCLDGLLHARVWDFGGQHVLHAMHEFFLRSRCLYLLVVEQRSNDVERDLTYWLQLIRSYAGDAPVVIALNQSKGVPRSLARAVLERDYGPILAWVPTECAPEEKAPGADATIEALREALTAAAAAMPEPKKLFPKKWLDIKQWLEGMREPYLDYATYAQHCAELHEHDPQQQNALAAAMDELGVALNYARDPRLRDTTVLRPNWLANGIYALLRANILAPRPLAPDGVLTEQTVGTILAAADRSKVLAAAEYPPEKWPFLLRLMNLFQLSFPLDERGLRYLVPTLLPADEPPDSGEPEGPGLVKLRYEFDVVPGPLVGRLLVRLFALIDGRKAWQRGARLLYAGAQARVWADLGETYVYATVSGQGRASNELLQMIREALKEMFREYQRLRVVEQWLHGNDWVPRGTLEQFGVLSRDTDSAEISSVGPEAAA